MTSVRRLRRLPALRLESASAGWGDRAVLDDFELEVAAGERIAILGPNGAGKTTLFDTISGRLGLRSGRLFLGRHDVSSLPLHRRARLGLGWVPQEPSAFGELTARQNLQAALASPVGRRSLNEAGGIDAVLEHWELEAVSERPAAVLSGGERRRLEVARMLLVKPSVLLLDEPFAGLDPSGRAILSQGLRSLAPRVALLVTDHAADDVLALADRVVLLIDGAVAFDGPVSDFSEHDPSYRRYFGASGG